MKVYCEDCRWVSQSSMTSESICLAPWTMGNHYSKQQRRYVVCAAKNDKNDCAFYAKERRNKHKGQKS